jgi:hypothetical protein
MHRIIILAAMIATTSATAQTTVRILTPSSDSCVAFTKAMDNPGDQRLLIALSGWALGFLSGVAQGTSADILRSASNESVMTRLYNECQKQPNKPMSVVLQEMARALVSGR